MKAKEFITLWGNFWLKIQEQNPNKYKKIVAHYENNKSWTDFILKGKSSELKAISIADFIEEQQGLNFYKEDLTFDVVFAKEFHKQVWSGNKTKQKNISESFYPSQYEILLEHENDISDCWREMVKLKLVKAKLKVLITYNYAEQESENFDYVKEKTIEDFKSIIQNSWQVQDEEYLLIIGQRQISIKGNNADTIHWSYISFDYKGNLFEN